MMDKKSFDIFNHQIIVYINNNYHYFIRKFIDNTYRSKRLFKIPLKIQHK